MDKKILEQDIISILGLDNLPEEKKSVLVAKMGEIILSRISSRILDSLTPEAQEELARLTRKKNNEEEVEEFLRYRVRNLDEIRQEEILKFKEQMAKDAAMLNQKIGG